ncbi:BQ5605_C042g12022 [Microbotryum silenes-dioicae]|uniref:BQ5605_C042g12022 protein n=1 Tax=Microbotryum silenes-dioicae TaxID=796604 RepID=A0A2X0MT65_9BASI|nr:BQ5605_C042g12022 [Microbotryum silenes-dioicae]
MRPTNMHIEMPARLSLAMAIDHATRTSSASTPSSSHSSSGSSASSSSSFASRDATSHPSINDDDTLLASAAAPAAPSLAWTCLAPSHGLRASPSTPMHDHTPPTTPLMTHPPGTSLALFGAGAGRRPSLLRRDSSVSSAASSVGDEDDTVEWTSEEQNKIKSVLEEYIESVEHAPFSSTGPPPSNLTSLVARAVMRANKLELQASTLSQAQANGTVAPKDESRPQKWRHGVRSTRRKVLAMVKEKQHEAIESTPRQDPDDTPRRKPLARQGSMDFLPEARNVAAVARLGSKLRRAEQAGPPLSASATNSYTSRPRAFRTASLSSIAGSPTQPPKAPMRPRPPGSPIKAPRMQRIGSDSTGLHHAEFAHLPSPGTSTSGMLWSEPSSSSSNSIFDLSFGAYASPVVTPKRGSELGSAFMSPAAGAAYPSPVSQKRAKHHHLALQDAPSLSLASPFETSFPTGVQNLAPAFGSAPPSAPRIVRPGPSPIKRRTGGRLGMSQSWADHLSAPPTSSSSPDDPTTASAFGFGAALDAQRLHPSSCLNSLDAPAHSRSPSPFDMNGTPSPLSSTFDLNDLSLEALDESKHGKTNNFIASNRTSYLEPSNCSQSLNEKLRDWDGRTNHAPQVHK